MENAEENGRAIGPSQIDAFGILGSLVIPLLAVTAVVLVMVQVQSRTEAGVAAFSELLPFGYAFGAGMVASVNPCGFFLLPSYASYHLGASESGFYESSRARRLIRGLLLSGLASGGFILLFVSVGLVLATGGTWLTRWFPYAGVVIGAAMAALGIWLAVSGRSASFGSPGRLIVEPKENQRNVFLFGIGYALGSLCCTLPVFLVVVGSGLAAGSWMASMGQFISYALGMATILAAVTVGTALFRDGATRWLRAGMPYVHRASSLFLVAAGAYVLYYWLFYADFFF